ncbi:MAG: nuclear transport factor 2 family protein [Acidimicrobiia bacterium]|nr:nuclear transport factor 2 family protein [Acidimicrobiia bacterium]
MNPDETVTEFIRRIVAKDVEGAFELCADHVVYENVPITAYEGKAAALEFLGGFVAGADELDWPVHRQAATGSVVMNERTDRFRFGEKWVEVKVVGVWEVEDGSIVLWRDYFDMAEMNAQLATLG